MLLALFVALLQGSSPPGSCDSAAPFLAGAVVVTAHCRDFTGGATADLRLTRASRAVGEKRVSSVEVTVHGTVDALESSREWAVGTEPNGDAVKVVWRARSKRGYDPASQAQGIRFLVRVRGPRARLVCAITITFSNGTIAGALCGGGGGPRLAADGGPVDHRAAAAEAAASGGPSID